MARRFGLWMLAVMLAVMPAFEAGAGPGVQKVTITMTDFKFTPEAITLAAGTRTELTLINTGKVEHEFMMHPMPMGQGSGGGMAMGQMGGKSMHDWLEENSYFKGLPMKIVVGGVEIAGRDIYEVEVAPGARAVLKFTPTKKGTFEIACHLPKHYEQGQKGTIVVQ